MVSPCSKLFVAVVVVLGAPKFLKFVAVAVVVPSILGLLVVLLLSPRSSYVLLVEALMRSNAGPQTGLKDEIDLH